MRVVKWSPIGTYAHDHLECQWLRAGPNKHAQSLSKGLSSPVLRLLEGKATICLIGLKRPRFCFAREAYTEYVSTEKWRKRR